MTKFSDDPRRNGDSGRTKCRTGLQPIQRLLGTQRSNFMEVAKGLFGGVVKTAPPIFRT